VPSEAMTRSLVGVAWPCHLQIGSVATHSCESVAPVRTTKDIQILGDVTMLADSRKL
jgi:hypothetical protein